MNRDLKVCENLRKITLVPPLGVLIQGLFTFGEKGVLDPRGETNNIQPNSLG